MLPHFSCMFFVCNLSIRSIFDVRVPSTRCTVEWIQWILLRLKLYLYTFLGFIEERVSLETEAKPQTATRSLPRYSKHLSFTPNAWEVHSRPDATIREARSHLHCIAAIATWLKFVRLYWTRPIETFLVLLKQMSQINCTWRFKGFV